VSFFRRQWVAKRAIVRTARKVRDRTGKGILSQLHEITRLRFGPGRLQAPHYFMYGVYDDRRYAAARKREVLSWHPARIAHALNARDWRAVCDDKLVCYGLLRGLGAPFPDVYAAFDTRRRTFDDVPTFSTPEEVATFLRDRMRYPFFAKQIGGGYGAGASSVASLDREQDCVVFTNGEVMPVNQYVDRYVVTTRPGYLFQQPVHQHPVVDRITGGRVGTLRMIVLNGDDAPWLFRAVWRIPVGGNITDNFLHGTRGNLVAQIDRELGRVEQVVQVLPVGPTAGDGLALGHPVETHPDTGEKITGVVIPNWEQVVSTCLHTAAALPGLRYQSWDVAVGLAGPLLLELNYRGDFGLAQVPGTRGFYDDEFRAFWRRYGASPARFWGKRP
jgi:hypothetical protein